MERQAGKSIEFSTRTKDKPIDLLRMGVDIRKKEPLCLDLPAVIFNDDAAFLTVRINQTLTATSSLVRTMAFRGYPLDKKSRAIKVRRNSVLGKLLSCPKSDCRETSMNCWDLMWFDNLLEEIKNWEIKEFRCLEWFNTL